MVETNAYYAFVATMKKENSKFKLTREQWKVNLGKALLHNPFIEQVERPVRSRQPPVMTHGLLVKV